ncbi:hypothetical protein [Erythrobacter sp. Alg231-14]|uniref:hypothetical protein n=1 Tax=Erythrobacter sp. Alg231-14 TaxID=1922225 RepID=UPI00307BC01B
MDRQRQSLILIGAAWGLFVTSAFAQEPLTIRELGWLSDDGQVEALITKPAFNRQTLLMVAADSSIGESYDNVDDLAADLLLGEFLFETPLLLGGQAAKAGLSCHSCHVNGRANPRFQFPAISGEPGTADTTHNFFSETLGNGVFDPVPIPDLTKQGNVSHDLISRDLERFLATIVVEEFAGSRPVQGAIPALATFVRALRLAPTDWDRQTQSQSITRDIGDAIATVEVAKLRSANREFALADLLLSGARNKLAMIHERLIPEHHHEEQLWLIDRSRKIGDIQSQMREARVSSNGHAGNVDRAFSLWLETVQTQPDFEAIEAQSLYNPKVLIERLGLESSD